MIAMNDSNRATSTTLALLVIRFVVGFCLMFSVSAFSAPPQARWILSEIQVEPSYGSFAAAQSAYTAAIEQYNSEPNYVCHVSDWSWTFWYHDWYRNAAFWKAATTNSHCIHNPPAFDFFRIKAWCGNDFATQPDGSCQCPADKPEEVNGRCFAPCPTDQFRGTKSFECKPRCPAGQYLTTSRTCVPLPPCTDQTSCPPPENADPEQGDPCTCSSTCVGNPINAATGGKFQSQADVSWGPGLEFTRFYNAGGKAAAGLPGGWRHNYSQQILIVYKNSYIMPVDMDPDWAIGFVPGTQVDHYDVVRPDGKTWKFSASGQPVAKTPENIYSLSLVGGGFLLQDGLTRENYDANGRLTRVERIGSSIVNLEYDANGNLSRLLDTRGYELVLGYDAQRQLISALGYGSGSSVYYGTDLAGRPYAQYADGNRRIYHYEDSSRPQLLTGITDEEGKRFATWTYDAQGRAWESKHAGDANKVTLTFSEDANFRYTDELDMLGATRRHTFKSFNKRWLPVSHSQPGGAGCSAASSNITYDTNGNVKTRTDFRGILTEYVINARGLETSRTEAKGTTEQRIISTEWHPTFRLPTKITEPGRITELQYDDKAHVTLKKVTDTTGTTAVIRSTTYVYVYNSDVNNPYIMKLTVNGPRADSVALDEVVYDFDSKGNLATVTRKNSSGALLVTRYSEYDGAGRARRITDADNRVTALFYTARGWLRKRIVGYGTATPLETTFTYYNTGLLKEVSLPDQNYVRYGYDDAHRLTDIFDRAGNSIKYELDKVGNRTREAVNDVNGTLAALLQQVDMAQSASRLPVIGEL